jgi:hypothetical protein
MSVCLSEPGKKSNIVLIFYVQQMEHMYNFINNRHKTFWVSESNNVTRLFVSSLFSELLKIKKCQTISKHPVYIQMQFIYTNVTLRRSRRRGITAVPHTRTYKQQTLIRIYMGNILRSGADLYLNTRQTTTPCLSLLLILPTTDFNLQYRDIIQWFGLV